jgi:hypothetical protein
LEQEAAASFSTFVNTHHTLKGQTETRNVLLDQQNLQYANVEIHDSSAFYKKENCFTWAQKVTMPFHPLKLIYLESCNSPPLKKKIGKF